MQKTMVDPLPSNALQEPEPVTGSDGYVRRKKKSILSQRRRDAK